MLVVTPTLAADIAKELPDYAERGINNVMLLIH
jgi:hypothetical protein